MPETTVWELEPHTKAKDELLRRYLGAWFAILANGGRNRRVVFLDGFAGPGIYEKGEPGSPIIAIDTFVSHKVFSDLDHTEFVFILIEPDEARCASLEAELASYDPDGTGLRGSPPTPFSRETQGVWAASLLPAGSTAARMQGSPTTGPSVTCRLLLMGSGVGCREPVLPSVDSTACRVDLSGVDAGRLREAVRAQDLAAGEPFDEGELVDDAFG